MAALESSKPRSVILEVAVLILLTLMLTSPLLLQTYITKKQIDPILSVKNMAVQNNTIPGLYRIRMDYHGTCIASSDGFNLEFLFCDPTQKQTFRFLKDGKMEYSSNGLCVSQGTEVAKKVLSLILGDCSTGISFDFVNGSGYLQTSGKTRRSKLCVSGRKFNHHPVKPSKTDPVVLIKCKASLSRLSLVEETIFIANRKPLLRPVPDNIPDCNFPACSINKRAPPVQLLSSSNIERCLNLSECVTVVIKTARRPHLVLRQVQSIREVKGYDLPIIAYDDGVDPYSEEIMAEIASFSNLQYIIGDDEDLGIALGRNLALQLVKTKYFLLSDDDLVFKMDSDIELLAEILDTTDASLAGGVFHGRPPFGGYFHFTSLNDEDELTSERGLNYYQGQCQYVNEKIIGFPTCLRCDATSNFFMAKTADILEVGCWSEELKIAEHKDLFLRLKAAGKKVVSCPKVRIFNRKAPGQDSKKSGYFALRKYRYRVFETLFTNIWNLHWVNSTKIHNTETFLKRKASILN